MSARSSTLPGPRGNPGGSTSIPCPSSHVAASGKPSLGAGSPKRRCRNNSASVVARRISAHCSLGTPAARANAADSSLDPAPVVWPGDASEDQTLICGLDQSEGNAGFLSFIGCFGPRTLLAPSTADRFRAGQVLSSERKSSRCCRATRASRHRISSPPASPAACHRFCR